jgi:mRNA interferase MazF
VNPGDIVLIRFPQADLQSGKLRPALVLATAPGRHDDFLLALISSRTQQAIDGFDEIIRDSDWDFRDTHLKVSSVIRLGRLATVEARVINARLGRISAIRLQAIKRRLAEWLSA